MNQCLSFLPTPDETEVALKLFGVNFPNPRLTVLVMVGVPVHDSSQRHVSRSQTLKFSPCILNWCIFETDPGRRNRRRWCRLFVVQAKSVALKQST
jgi:hypothetical protein